MMTDEDCAWQRPAQPTLTGNKDQTLGDNSRSSLGREAFFMRGVTTAFLKEFGKDPSMRE